MSQRIGILGGTFNPIHFGHLAAAEEICGRLKLDQVVFIPSFLPPHKDERGMPSALQRQEMVELAIRGNPRFTLSDREIRRGGVSYSIDTIEELRQEHAGAELFFITGIDSFLEIGTWKEWARLLTLCSFVVLSREGYRFRSLGRLGFLHATENELEALDARRATQATIAAKNMNIHLERVPLYDISSTDIRSRVRSGRSIKYHLPDAVERYIIDHRLYA